MNLFGLCVEMEVWFELCIWWCCFLVDFIVWLSGFGVREFRWWEEFVMWEVVLEFKLLVWIMCGSVDWDGLIENIRIF